MFNLVNIGERSGSGVPNIFNTWEDQGWKEPVIEERFDPDRTILTLEFVDKTNKEKAAKKSGEEKTAKKSGEEKTACPWSNLNAGGVKRKRKTFESKQYEKSMKKRSRKLIKKRRERKKRLEKITNKTEEKR